MNAREFIDACRPSLALLGCENLRLRRGDHAPAVLVLDHQAMGGTSELDLSFERLTPLGAVVAVAGDLWSRGACTLEVHAAASRIVLSSTERLDPESILPGGVG